MTAPAYRPEVSPVIELPPIQPQPLAGPDAADQHHQAGDGEAEGPAEGHESSRLRILPVAVIGRLGDELDDARVLVAGHLLLAPRDQLVLGDRGAVLEDHDRLDLLAVALVRDADDGGQRDVGVRHQHLFDLARVHVVAAADDHVLGPVDDVVPAVLVAAAEVAGAEPAVLDRLLGRVGPAVVALHDVVALDRDLADRVLGPARPRPSRPGRSASSRHRGPGSPIEPTRTSSPYGEKLATGEVSESP